MSNAALHVVHGGMGQGKGLVSVGLLSDYLKKSLKVATNIDLYLEHLPIGNSNSKIIRVADLPTSDDILAIGDGWPDDFNDNDYDESKRGILVLDEALVWANSREFNKKGRNGLNKVLVMMRKRGWNTFILIQDYEGLDSQIRRGIGKEHIVCSAQKGLPVPFIGWIISLIWMMISGSVKWHRAKYVTGTGNDAVKNQDRYFLGKKFYKGYNTRQEYIEDEGNHGNASMLPLSYIRNYYGTSTRTLLVKSWHTFFAGFLIAFFTFSGGSSSSVVSKAFALPSSSSSIAAYQDDLSGYVKSLRLGFSMFNEENPDLSEYDFFIEDQEVRPERQGLTVIPRNKDSVFLRKDNRVFTVYLGYPKVTKSNTAKSLSDLNFVPSLLPVQKPTASDQDKSET